MRSRRIAVAAVLAVVTFAVGCGGVDDDSSTATLPPPSSSVATAAPTCPPPNIVEGTADENAPYGAWISFTDEGDKIRVLESEGLTGPPYVVPAEDNRSFFVSATQEDHPDPDAVLGATYDYYEGTPVQDTISWVVQSIDLTDARGLHVTMASGITMVVVAIPSGNGTGLRHGQILPDGHLGC